MSPLKGSLQPQTECAGQGSGCAANGHSHPHVHTDQPVMLPAARIVLEAKGNLIHRALHGLQHLLRIGIIAHKDKVLAPVRLEDGQHIGQLPGLHRDKHKVIHILGGQHICRLHPIHRCFPLEHVADGQALLVDDLLPLAPGQQGDHIFLVLCQTVGQLTALNACAVHQDPHNEIPPVLHDQPGQKHRAVTFSGTRRSPFSHRAGSARRSRCSPFRQWQPSAPPHPPAAPRR